MAERALHSLKGIAILDTVSKDALGRLEQRCRWRTYARDQEVIASQDDATEVYFLISGRARIVLHTHGPRDVVFRTLGSGEIFGELAAIDGEPRSATVQTLEPCLVASTTSWDFRNLICDEPEFALALTRHLATEVRRLTARVFDFSTLAVHNRIHAELLRLAGGRKAGRGEAVIAPMPTHLEIAGRLSTHREAVTRELGRLARAGLVERRGNALIIKDLGGLADMVRDARSVW